MITPGQPGKEEQGNKVENVDRGRVETVSGRVTNHGVGLSTTALSAYHVIFVAYPLLRAIGTKYKNREHTLCSGWIAILESGSSFY